MLNKTIKTLDWLLNVKTESEVFEKTKELKSDVLSLFDRIDDLTKKNKTLKKKYTELKEKIKKLDDYKLVKIDTGIFVYMQKDSTNSPADSPWYCTNCKNNFQRLSIMNQDIDNWYTCPNCDNAFQYRISSKNHGFGVSGKSITSNFKDF